MNFKPFLFAVTTLSCLSAPVAAVDLFSALDEMFGLSKQSTVSDLNRDYDHPGTPMSVPVDVPVGSNVFKKYEVYTPKGKDNVCGVIADFDDSSLKAYDRFKMALSLDFGGKGKDMPTDQRSRGNVKATIDKVVWDGAIDDALVDEVVLIRSVVNINGSRSATNAITIQFSDFRACMMLD